MNSLSKAAIACAGLMAAFAVTTAPASALPLEKSPATPQGAVEQIGRGGGGHGGGPRGGGGPGFHGGGGPRFHGPGPGGPHFHGPRFGGPRFYGPRYGGFYPYGYGYGYGFGAYPYFDSYAAYDDCRWLRRKAQATRSRYWWNRYRACIED